MPDRPAPTSGYGSHHLWQRSDSHRGEPEQERANEDVASEYRLRITVLKDGEEQGDVPARTYHFPSLHHLTHATNSIDAAFSPPFEVKKAGVEAPEDEVDAGRGGDGHLERVEIEFTTVEDEDEDGNIVPKEDWHSFLKRLKALEEVWEAEVKSRM